MEGPGGGPCPSDLSSNIFSVLYVELQRSHLHICMCLKKKCYVGGPSKPAAW